MTAHAPICSEPTVVNCYNILDRIFPEIGLQDFTEGIYNGDPTLALEKAQKNQINWLLDQIECVSGSTILDIGCGNGALLQEAEKRGANAMGITISQQQVKRCRDSGLDVHLMNYRNMDREWHDKFDGIVANGSMEHFVQPQEVIARKQDTLYRGFFKICGCLLNPLSSSRKVATTVIHYNRLQPHPRDLLRSPWGFRPFSDEFHCAFLQRCFGGYYPSAGQLQRCAAPWFEIVAEIDATHDYHLTSEEWLRRIRRSLLHWRKGPRVLCRLLPYVLQNPSHGLLSLSTLITASWQWQFRGAHPPMKLLRHVWRYQPHVSG